MALNEDMDRIVLQEKELTLPRLDANVAWELGTRLRTLAIERGHAIVIDVRRFGQPLFYVAQDGTTPDNVEWVRRKSNTVARFHRSSLAMHMRMESKKSSLLDRYGLPLTEYVSDGGAFPLAVEGAGVVGSVTVSGLSAREDHELVVEALCGMLGRRYDDLRLAAE